MSSFRKSFAIPFAMSFCLLLVLFAGPGSAQLLILPQDPATVSGNLLDQLQAGKYEAATTAFTPEMQAALPAQRLADTWAALPGQLGALTSIGKPVASKNGAMTEVVTPLNFERMALVSRVVVDANGRIAGFRIVPAPPPDAPALGNDAGFSENEVRIGDPNRALPATLALPTTTERVAGVALVHGSGPHDRNETIGPNRPFMDLARGLAARGIAVLRYEKRTHARPQDYADGDFDMDDETTDDAVAAVAFLAANEHIDADRIFVLGHSQGGMLAPRIAQQSPHPVAGLILAAAPARSLLDLLPEQYRYLFSLDGGIDATDQQRLDELAQQIANVRSDGDFDATQLPLGQSAHYWRRFDAVDPVADAKQAALPMLILQGGRDFQVIDHDIARWHAAFDGNPAVAIREYPKLNHLFIAGDGPGTPAEYQQAGTVDARVIADIANWINAQSPR